eukprot:4372369-Amphidinium_carterae.4
MLWSPYKPLLQQLHATSDPGIADIVDVQWLQVAVQDTHRVIMQLLGVCSQTLIRFIGLGVAFSTYWQALKQLHLMWTWHISFYVVVNDNRAVTHLLPKVVLVKKM